MRFLTDTEFIILMNPNPFVLDNWCAPPPIYVPTLEDRVRYRAAGIQTAVEYPMWHVMEPVKGTYDFSMIETILRLNREAGLKTIFPIHNNRFPDWMPDDWMYKNKDGAVSKDGISFWNTDAQEHNMQFYRDFLAEFSDEDVLCVLAENGYGESLLPCAPSFYDASALQDYRDKYGSSAVPDISLPETKEWLTKTAISHIMKIQTLFHDVGGEVWNMLQLLMNQWSEATINYVQPDLLKLFREAWPDDPIILLQYTYFDDSHGQDNVDYVDMLRDISGCDVVVEAHFCAGLRMTTPLSIAKGFIGQIVSPTHPMSGKHRIEDWMFDEIAWAHNTWTERTLGK